MHAPRQGGLPGRKITCLLSIFRILVVAAGWFLVLCTGHQYEKKIGDIIFTGALWAWQLYFILNFFFFALDVRLRRRYGAEFKTSISRLDPLSSEA